MNSIQVVSFYLGLEEYGLPISCVREIIANAKTTRIPKAQPHVEGLYNLRGEIIPVFNLRTLFALERGLIRPNASSVIVAEFHDEVFGVRVDEVHQVLWMPTDQIEPPGVQGRSPAVSGIGKYDGRLIILLDLNGLFDAVQDEDPATAG